MQKLDVHAQILTSATSEDEEAQPLSEWELPEAFKRLRARPAVVAGLRQGLFDLKRVPRKKGQSFDAWKAQRHRRPQQGDIIQLVPLVAADLFDAAWLPECIKCFFGMEVKVLSPLSKEFVESKVAQRGCQGYGVQLYTQDLHKVLKQMNGKRGTSQVFATLAYTHSFDLYPGSYTAFVYGQANPATGTCVVSAARYLSIDPDTAHRCCARTLCHEVGHIFGLAHCIWYDCIMRGKQCSPDKDLETDVQPLHVCPTCLAKLDKALGGMDLVARETGLEAFWRKVGHEPEAEWCRRRINAISEEEAAAELRRLQEDCVEDDSDLEFSDATDPNLESDDDPCENHISGKTAVQSSGATLQPQSPATPARLVAKRPATAFRLKLSASYQCKECNCVAQSAAEHCNVEHHPATPSPRDRPRGSPAPRLRRKVSSVADLAPGASPSGVVRSKSRAASVSAVMRATSAARESTHEAVCPSGTARAPRRSAPPAPSEAIMSLSLFPETAQSRLRSKRGASRREGGVLNEASSSASPAKTPMRNLIKAQLLDSDTTPPVGSSPRSAYSLPSVQRRRQQHISAHQSPRGQKASRERGAQSRGSGEAAVVMATSKASTLRRSMSATLVNADPRQLGAHMTLTPPLTQPRADGWPAASRSKAGQCA